MLEPISKTRLSEVAVSRIRDYILEQNLQPGYQLPSERQLGESLGISRASVREALRILEIVGMIEVRPGSGSYVKNRDGDLSMPLSTWLPKDAESLREHYEIRQLLEPRCASLAAQRVTPEIVKALQEQMELFSGCVEQGDLEGMILADTEFHRLLGLATQNRMLSLLMNTISRYLHEGWEGVLPIPGRAESTIREHNEIYQAVKAHDPVTAKSAMARHLSNAIADLQATQEES